MRALCLVPLALSLGSILALTSPANAQEVLAQETPAQDSPTESGAAMTAEEFDQYATGKTLTYSQYGQIYGTEEYLPNRRVRWQVTGDLCQYGHWYEKQGLICFAYEYSQGEHCWTFWEDESGLRALSVDDLPGSELSEVKNAAQGLSCPDLDVGV